MLVFLNGAKKEVKSIIKILASRHSAGLRQAASDGEIYKIKTCGVVDLRSSDALRRETKLVYAQQ